MIDAVGFPAHPTYAVTVFRDRVGITLAEGVVLYVYSKNKWSLWRFDKPLVTERKAPSDSLASIIIEARKHLEEV